MAAKRNSPGQGSVYAEGDGFVAQIRINGRTIRRRAKTRKLAQARLDEIRTSNALGLPIPTAQLTVNDACDRFLNYVVPAKGSSASTIERYEWAIERHFRPAFGKKRLRDLTPMHLESLLGDLAAEGKATATLQKLRSILRMILDEGEKQGWVHRNIAKLAKVPPAQDEVARRAMTEDEVQKLLVAGRGTSFEALVQIAISRALRPGELLGLKWSDLDLDSSTPTLRIERTAKRVRGRAVTGAPKTERSRRTLQLSQPTVAVLRRHRTRQNRVRLSSRSWSDNDLVFPTRNGTLMHASNFRRDFAKLTDAAGIGTWTPNEMRHSSISLLAASGSVSIEELADLAGHIDTRMVMKTYRHAQRAVDAGASVLDYLANDESEIAK